MTDKVKLHVGYVGRTRDGKRVEIVSSLDGAPGWFKGDDQEARKRNGHWQAFNIQNKFDIIGPWTEPTAEYPVGQWIGWNGGECPVHPETVVDVKFCDGHESKGHDADAWDWGDVPTNIVSFCIVTPYVEPKPPLECWVTVDDDGDFYMFQELIDAEYHQLEYGGTITRMVEAGQ